MYCQLRLQTEVSVPLCSDETGVVGLKTGVVFSRVGIEMMPS